MPVLKQPERGIRTEYEARYGYSANLALGVDDSHDSSTLPDEALAVAENARLVDGLLVSRGGQTKASAVMDGAVVGMIETEDVP